jgi:hypothetical protein
MSCYVDFYRGKTPTACGGFFISDILDVRFDNDMLESEHRYIQWIFPMKVLSQAQPGAANEPLTDEAIQVMRSDQAIQCKVEKVVVKMLDFWGMALLLDKSVIVVDPLIFKKKLGLRNHNQLRMTRMLTFLRYLEWPLVDSIKEVLFANVNQRSAALQFWGRV